jgi:hypothetical protein
MLIFSAFATDEMGSPPGKGRADGVYRKPRRRPARFYSYAALRAPRSLNETRRNVFHAVTRKAPPVRAGHNRGANLYRGSEAAMCPPAARIVAGQLTHP